MSVSKVEDPKVPVSVKTNEDPIIDAAKAAVDSLEKDAVADAEGDVVADGDAKEIEEIITNMPNPHNDLELGAVCRDFMTLDAIICTVVVVSFVSFFASLTAHVPKEEECVLEGF
jgi:hypothetical protein